MLLVSLSLSPVCSSWRYNNEANSRAFTFTHIAQISARWRVNTLLLTVRCSVLCNVLLASGGLWPRTSAPACRTVHRIVQHYCVFAQIYVFLFLGRQKFQILSPTVLNLNIFHAFHFTTFSILYNSILLTYTLTYSFYFLVCSRLSFPALWRIVRSKFKNFSVIKSIKRLVIRGLKYLFAPSFQFSLHISWMI